MIHADHHPVVVERAVNHAALSLDDEPFQPIDGLDAASLCESGLELIVDELGRLVTRSGRTHRKAMNRGQWLENLSGLDSDINFECPWLQDAIKRVEQLPSSKPFFEDPGIALPNAKSVSAAIEVLNCLAKYDLEPSRINKCSEEGVTISFRRPDRYADIECFNSGLSLAGMKVKRERSTIWEVGDTNLNSSVAKICEFLALSD